MQDSYWKTTGQVPTRDVVEWPTLGQGLRQVGLVAIMLIIWAAVLGAFIWLDAPGSETVIAGEPEPSTVAPAPTETPTQEPSSTPTATSTPTTTATPFPAETVTQSPESGSTQTPTPTATLTPAPTSTPTPAPTMTPTETPSPAASAVGIDAVSFSADVLPILERRCVKCHGGEKTEQGLRLTNYAEVVAGSWNGPVLEPGNAAESYLIEQVESGEMPKNEPRLLPAEIRTLTDWVLAGAPDN